MSSFNQTETVPRFHDAVTKQHMSMIAEIDHAEAARVAKVSPRPTKILVFGTAFAGTPPMRVIPTIGIDLPLKVLGRVDGFNQGHGACECDECTVAFGGFLAA